MIGGMQSPAGQASAVGSSKSAGGRHLRLRRPVGIISAALCCLWLCASVSGTGMSMEARLQAMLTAMAADSYYISASDMGVHRYNWSFAVDNPTYPHSPPQLQVRLHMFIRYFHWDGLARVKGFIVAETRDASKFSGIPIEPVFTLRTLGQTPRENHVFLVKSQVHSYWDPPHQAAMVYGFEHNFTLSASPRHEYELLLDRDPSTVHTLRPAKALNLLDGRGLELPPVLPSADPAIKRETFVVLKPLYNFTPTVFGPLIDRHVAYYQTLGVSKHIIYLRRESIPQLVMANPQVAQLVLAGKVLLVLWDGLPEHTVWSRKYDQRVIYSHAVLALTSMDVYMMNIDLDEYLVTTRPTLQTKNIQEIVETCAGQPGVAEARVMRYHSVCKACDRYKPEALIWTNYQDANHPLSWYHLTNYLEPPAGRAVVNPNFLRAFYVHYGSVMTGHNTTYPQPKCMFFMHIANMVRVTEGPEVVAAKYVEDHSWMGLLKRFKRTTPLPTAKRSATRRRTEH